jgi:hypothetical protein
MLLRIGEETLLYLFVRLHGDLPEEVEDGYRFPAPFVAAHRDTAVRLIRNRFQGNGPPERVISAALDRLVA